MKAKLLTFIEESQKFLGAVAGFLAILVSQVALEDPYAGYATMAGAVLGATLTYVLPYVKKVVEDAGEPSELPADEADTPPPTVDTPEVVALVVAPDTRPMDINELLHALAKERLKA